MNPELFGLTLLAFFVLGLCLLFFRDYLYKKSYKEVEEKLNLPTDTLKPNLVNADILSGPVIAAASQGPVARFSAKHQFMIAIIFAVIAVISMWTHALYSCVGFALLSVCFLASWSLKRWLPGYRNTSVISQMCFGLVLLLAIIAIGIQVARILQINH